MKYNVVISPEKRKDKDNKLKEKNVPIFADIRFSGNRIFYFTGFRIDLDKFDFKERKARKNSIGKEGNRKVQYNIINDRLLKIESALGLFFTDVSSATKEEVIDLLNKTCKKAEKNSVTQVEGNPNEFFPMLETYIETAIDSPDRIRKFRSLINHWKRFESHRREKITFSAINVEVLREFEKYLKNDKGDYKRGRKKGRNSINTILASTRIFWNFSLPVLKDRGIVLHYPFGKSGYKLPGEIYGDPIYISAQERDFLFKLEMKNERLERVRDLFVLQCFVGMRVGDFIKLTKDNIQDGILSYVAGKTKEDRPKTIRVPLHDKALEIISRYDLPGGRLMPFISGQKYNDYIKELFKFAGLDRIVTCRNPTTGESEQVPICNIASSHMARRTFIGGLYDKAKDDVIGSMSGHKPGSKAFARYYTVNEKMKKDAINLL